ncbi:helix-turn-helix domain-containing protein [Streptomyces sp. NPDC002755]
MIGDRLRNLRTARGLTLRALAQLVGVSPTLLSQVERGITDPSLNTLRRLSDAFGLHVADLLIAEPAASPYVSRPGARTLVGAESLPIERLTPRNEVLEVARAVLKAGEASTERPYGHFSVECVYVVSGTLSADVGGQVHLVQAGEAITFPPGIAHRYFNDSSGKVEVIISTSPPLTT